VFADVLSSQALELGLFRYRAIASRSGIAARVMRIFILRQHTSGVQAHSLEWQSRSRLAPRDIAVVDDRPQGREQTPFASPPSKSAHSDHGIRVIEIVVRRDAEINLSGSGLYSARPAGPRKSPSGYRDGSGPRRRGTGLFFRRPPKGFGVSRPVVNSAVPNPLKHAAKPKAK